MDPATSLCLISSSLMIGHQFSASTLRSAPSRRPSCAWKNFKPKVDNSRLHRRIGQCVNALSLPIISLGMPLGANSPYQPEQVGAGSPSRQKVGMSGTSRLRLPAFALFALFAASGKAWHT